MDIRDLRQEFDTESTGAAMHGLIRELYPICRSITGDGFRETLRSLRRFIDLDIHEVPSGTRAFDWTVPKEWNIRDAYIKDSRGVRVVDFKASSLHVMSYSTPVHETMSLDRLKDHLHTIPDKPDLIPYRTSYYKEDWGFCLSHNDLSRLREGEYDVCIDSTLEEGSLTYGEYYLPGETRDEILVSCHSCHPSMCNDNLSGVALSTFAAKLLTPLSRRYSYRFLFIPGAIGSITWLSANEEKTADIKHGLVVACVGDGGGLTYKKSRRGNAEIDEAVQHVLRHRGQPYAVREFIPYGYDERQYCSPGFNLAVGSLTRTPHGAFPQYHTSADNLDFVQGRYLADSLSAYLSVFQVLEENRTYSSLNARCEPQLGKRGLYSAIGGRTDSPTQEMALLWVLNLADGEHTLLDVAERAGLPFDVIANAARLLVEHALLVESTPGAALAAAHGDLEGRRSS
jgi:aminopeptidase-like protein